MSKTEITNRLMNYKNSYAGKYWNGGLNDENCLKTMGEQLIPKSERETGTAMHSNAMAFLSLWQMCCLENV